MSELRWILLALGIVLIAGVWLFSRRPFPKFPLRLPRVSRVAEDPVIEVASTDAAAAEPAPPRQRRRPAPEKVVTLRIVCRNQSDMDAEDAVLALKRVGLVHGRYGIFHHLADDGGEEPLFSIASLTEPGSFDLDNLEDTEIAGLSLFLILPGRGDPIARFDLMIELARSLAEDLDGILLDERGSSWSVQRERYIREEIIRFHHQLSRA